MIWSDHPDLNKLREPEIYLTSQFGKTVVLDEIQRQPELFPLLRSLVDEQVRGGLASGQYLVLGSASPDLLRQSSESLAGRILYLELTPLTIEELEAHGPFELERHWQCGGFPRSYLAATVEESAEWRSSFIRTYVERDIPQLGLNLPAEQLQRFWSMLGHGQGNQPQRRQVSSQHGRVRYNDSQVLGPAHRLVHGSATTAILRQLDQAPGEVAQSLRARLWPLTCTNEHPPTTRRSSPTPSAECHGKATSSRTSAPPPPRTGCPTTTEQARGAEIDLVFETPSKERIAIEIKRTLSPKPSRGFRSAAEDIRATHRYFVMPSGDPYPLDRHIEAISFPDLHRLVRESAG